MDVHPTLLAASMDVHLSSTDIQPSSMDIQLVSYEASWTSIYNFWTSNQEQLDIHPPFHGHPSGPLRSGDGHPTRSLRIVVVCPYIVHGHPVGSPRGIDGHPSMIPWTSN
jgi:hypothetical protein